MALTEAFSGTETVSTTEWSLTNDSSTIAAQTTDGFFCVELDLNALAAGDQFQFRSYEKCRSGDTQRVRQNVILTAADGPLWESIPVSCLHGWDFTLKKLAGTDRTILWSIRQAN